MDTGSIGGHHFAVNQSGTGMVSINTYILTVGVLFWREGLRAFRTLKKFVLEGLPTMINELQLFLAAGVLAAGLVTITSSSLLPELSGFTAVSAALLLGAMILLAVMGLHPVVTISGVTPLVMTHLVFQGRYGIPSWKGAVWNWPYVLFMYGLAVLLLHAVAVLV